MLGIRTDNIKCSVIFKILEMPHDTAWIGLFLNTSRDLPETKWFITIFLQPIHALHTQKRTNRLCLNITAKRILPTNLNKISTRSQPTTVLLIVSESMLYSAVHKSLKSRKQFSRSLGLDGLRPFDQGHTGEKTKKEPKFTYIWFYISENFIFHIHFVHLEIQVNSHHTKIEIFNLNIFPVIQCPALLDVYLSTVGVFLSQNTCFTYQPALEWKKLTRCYSGDDRTLIIHA